MTNVPQAANLHHPSLRIQSSPAVEIVIDQGLEVATPVPLDAHTDNPHRTPAPGLQLLHCPADETRGGAATSADGFAGAEALRRHVEN